MGAEQIIGLSSFGALVIALLVWSLKELWASCKRSIACKVDNKVCEIVHEKLDEKLDYIQAKLDDIHQYLIER